MNEFHFLQHVNSCVSGVFTSFPLFRSLYFLRLQACSVSFLSVGTNSPFLLMGFMKMDGKLFFWVPPFFFWMKHKHYRETESLTCWLAPSLPTALMLSCAQFAPLPSPPTLPSEWILSLSYISCLLSASVLQYNCNDSQPRARKKPSCLKDCLDQPVCHLIQQEDFNMNGCYG